MNDITGRPALGSRAPASATLPSTTPRLAAPRSATHRTATPRTATICGAAVIATIGLALLTGCSAYPQAAAGPTGAVTATAKAAATPAAPATVTPLPTTVAVPSASPSTGVQAASGAPPAVPTLGQLAGVFANGTGFGQVRPARIFNGGDPTGLVTHLVWTSWGGPRAVATGRTDYVGPGQSVATGTEQSATVVAFNLGTCDGKLMYEAVEWYFPQHGQDFDASHYQNICSGSYVPGS